MKTIGAVALLLAGMLAAQPTVKTLAGVAGQIYGGLLIGPDGAIYGPTVYGGMFAQGSVFQLTAPAQPGGTWVQTTLHSFQGPDGEHPQGALVMGKSGVIYGTANGGAHGAGVVFSLSSPQTAGGSWGERLLYSFTGGNDGRYPVNGLSFGLHGELYGTTAEGGAYNLGTVFEMTPPSSAGGAWTQTLIYTFGSQPGDGGNPAGALLVDKHGSLYGSTAATVYELSPPTGPGGEWPETTLYSGEAGNKVSMDSSGNLFSTSTYGGGTGQCQSSGGSGCGSVFQLTPPAVAGGAWTETTLHAFAVRDGEGIYPQGGVLIGKDGTLYGTTEFGGLTANSNGSFFWLTPPSAAGGMWTETVLPIGDANATPFASLSTHNGIIYGAGVASVFELKYW